MTIAPSVQATIIVGILLALITAGGYAGFTYKSNADRAESAEASVAVQGTVIQAMQDQAKAFSVLSASTSGKNLQASAKSEETVIEYRTILRSEKTCDLPVPADISDGLLRYANRLRASAVQTDTGRSDQADTGTTSPRVLTYCQAVLWIHPLLTAIEQANNQLSAIRQAEKLRQEPSK